MSEQYLVRHTPDKNIIDPDVGLIYEKAICSPSESNMPDLSTSLLGVFQIEHIQISLTHIGIDVFSHYCEPDIVVEPIPIYEQDFLLDPERGCWLVQILKIHDEEADYKYNEDKLKAVCKVIHSPMAWNFWHFSVRWFLEKDNCYWHELEESDRKKKWSQRLAHETRSLVRKFATIELPEPNEIQPECYTKP